MLGTGFLYIWIIHCILRENVIYLNHSNKPEGTYLELQNSYIFLGNPYRKTGKSDNPSVVTLEKSLPSYIMDAFPNAIKESTYEHFYKRKYDVNLQNNNITCKVKFICTEVVGTYYLDVVVTGKTKSQIVNCLENIQNSLLVSGVRERYIDIISYDAVSEYYCNKIYPKLNALERNLRKLLFNIYIVNFGEDYYRATVDTDLQGKIKKVINVDSGKEGKSQIQSHYKAPNKKEAEEIERLQRFFYSFEYNDIQKLLFTQGWTNADETEKNKFLETHADLSKLSNEKLREAFSKYTPKSDWERFFSSKINISDIEDLIEQLRVYRNSVAHFKFFYKDDYNKCNKLTNHLNSAIIKAIQITEEKDFSEKNSGTLSAALEGLIDIFAEYKKAFAEIAQKVVSSIITPITGALAKSVEEGNWIKSLGTFAMNNCLTEEAKAKQELEDSIKPLTSLKDNLIPPWANETQNMINHIKIDTPFTELSTNNALSDETSPLNEDEDIEEFNSLNRDNEENT